MGISEINTKEAKIDWSPFEEIYVEPLSKSLILKISRIKAKFLGAVISFFSHLKNLCLFRCCSRPQYSPLVHVDVDPEALDYKKPPVKFSFQLTAEQGKLFEDEEAPAPAPAKGPASKEASAPAEKVVEVVEVVKELAVNPPIDPWVEFKQNLQFQTAQKLVYDSPNLSDLYQRIQEEKNPAIDELFQQQLSILTQLHPAELAILIQKDKGSLEKAKEKIFPKLKLNPGELSILTEKAKNFFEIAKKEVFFKLKLNNLKITREEWLLLIQALAVKVAFPLLKEENREASSLKELREIIEAASKTSDFRAPQFASEIFALCEEESLPLFLQQKVIFQSVK